jgi:hypothetical protein
MKVKQQTTDAKSAVDLMLIFVSMAYAVSASESLLTRVRFLELRNHLGND